MRSYPPHMHANPRAELTRVLTSVIRDIVIVLSLCYRATVILDWFARV